MTSRIAQGLCFAAVAMGVGVGAAWAQESTNRVAANTDWSVFVEGDPQECWSVSKPKQTVNTKDGRSVAVNRGDILLFVSYRADAKGVVSFTGGYPFAGGSTVTLTVGDSTFNLFTDGEWAWSGGPEEDAKIVAALKNGANAVLVGNSSRGTRTEDTFSLMGFTAAVDDAGARCQ
ncbi:invasion associated locus B family protein [Maritimibacter sp. DP1N21-5]|uniref:invasion associated locus B family protein n=1 Tax=Maritimibacter sp. DP1N21-5 TaxID=2836867 RepID=UPI001C479E04|nr:invasion associated locus B family protein [Maritimibacter sp. DP1N21-5]MBV7407962.1 hypothetical protein [Maritimibacter sp. DP1N21-5]